jgi:hypothetical protein
MFEVQTDKNLCLYCTEMHSFLWKEEDELSVIGKSSLYAVWFKPFPTAFIVFRNLSLMSLQHLYKCEKCC